MALIDYAALTAPIDEAAPCGPDLDFEGDLDFLNYVARAEGLLPTKYIELNPKGGGYVVFDRLPEHIPIAYGDEIQAIAGLLARSRDLRLLGLLAKFHILNRDISGFADTIAATGRLVAERWESAHPGADGDYSLRSVVLETLDDAATVVQPLAHAPLVMSRRFGAISHRNIMVRRGEATAREDEEVPDEATIEDAFDKVEFGELVRRRDELARVKDALALIRATWVDKAGYGQAIAFPKLAPVVDAALRTLDEAVGRRDPSARVTADGDMPAAAGGGEEAGDARPAPVATGKIASVAQAAAALAAAAGYYAKHEPSSPALLLTRQAQSLMGKSFHEVIEALMPNHAEQASIRFGVDAVFDLPIQRLSAAAASESSFEETSAESGWGTESEAEAETAGESEGEAVPNGAAGHTPDTTSTADGSARRIGAAQTRQEAVALLQQVGSFYRASEPASPIPLFTERACGLSQKDFLTLLKDVLPNLKATVSE